MARKFTRTVTKKTKTKLKPSEIQDLIEKEFVDSKGNKMKFRFDFRPHPINEPTIQWQRDYGEDK